MATLPPVDNQGMTTRTGDVVRVMGLPAHSHWTLGFGRRILAAVFAFLAGCAHQKPVEKMEMGMAGIESEAECSAVGGQWKRLGMADVRVCDRRPADAGKRCNSNDQCQTLCVADETATEGSKTDGRCFDSTFVLGRCIAMISKGVVGERVCTD
jgi:hypothetical protein